MDVIFNDLTSIAGATSAATDAEGASRLIVERYEARGRKKPWKARRKAEGAGDGWLGRLWMK